MNNIIKYVSLVIGGIGAFFFIRILAIGRLNDDALKKVCNLLLIRKKN